MPNRFSARFLALLAMGLPGGAAVAQSDDALIALYAQQATQVRTLIEQISSSDANRQQFAVWQLELELAIPPGAETQPMLEEAAGAGALEALGRLSSAADAELAASAAGLHANLIDALGISRAPVQPRSILNGAVSESLGPVDQPSWLALDIEAGKEYSVRAAACDLISAIIVASGDLSVVDGGFAVKSAFRFTSDRDDSVLMRVRPSNCSSAAMVNVSSGAPMRSIDGAFSSRQAVFVSDGRYMGRLADNDQQWMYLSMPAGRTVEIVANPEGYELDTYLTIYDVTGQTRLAEDDDGGNGLGSRLVYTSASDREVLIEVSRLGSDWGDYLLSISEMLPPSERGQRVELGTSYAGDLTFDSREWWVFQPAAGVRYRIDIDPDPGLDSYLKLYESDGSTLIDEDDDSGDGLGSRIDFTRPSDEIVMIEVNSLDGEPGTYQLMLSESTLRFAHDGQAVGVGSYMGHLDYDEESFWRLNTPAGRYRVEVRPIGDLDSTITLYDAEGADELDYDDDGGQGFGSLLQFASASDTTHVLAVGSFGGAGNFELTLTALPNPAQLAEAALPGGSYRSGIREGDERWWRIETEAGVSYDIEALPQDDLDTIIELYAADGVTQLDSDDDGGQGFGSRIRHVSVSGEPILIRVMGFSGSTGEFELFVR